MSKITQQELAAKLGVSRSTVAAALNPASTIKLNEATRRRILAAAKRLQYRPDRYARVMRGGRSGLIGILHFGGLLQVAAERAFHAANAVRREGYEVVSADLSWSAASLQAACDSLLDARVEGVIVSGLNTPGAARELERLRGLPVVGLSGNPLPWAPFFRGDTRQALQRLTRHLLALGHRRLALMTHIANREEPGTYIWSGRERVRGFEAALLEADGRLVEGGFSPGRKPQGLVARIDLSKTGFDPFVPGLEGMRALLNQRVRPTAVVCSNDEIAYGALRACHEAGVAVPQEMALTGYDDTALGRYCQVPLTTVRQPNEAMADAAVRALLCAVEKGPERKKPVLFPCEILLRASTEG